MQKFWTPTQRITRFLFEILRLTLKMEVLDSETQRNRGRFMEGRKGAVFPFFLNVMSKNWPTILGANFAFDLGGGWGWRGLCCNFFDLYLNILDPPLRNTYTRMQLSQDNLPKRILQLLLHYCQVELYIWYSNTIGHTCISNKNNKIVHVYSVLSPGLGWCEFPWLKPDSHTKHWQTCKRRCYP